MGYLTGASILPLENAQLRINEVSCTGKYTGLACNSHLSVEWDDSIEFGAENPKRLVDDLIRKDTKFTGDGSLPRALESDGRVVAHHAAHPCSQAGPARR